MPRTPLQRALGASRLLCLAGTLAAGAYYWLVTFESPWVDAKRDRWVQKDTWAHEEELRALERAADRDPATGIPALEAYVASLGKVRQEDRALRFARGALAAIARLQENDGKFEAAVATLNRSLALQPTDLPGRVWHARLLCRSATTRGEGLHRLRELQRQLPEVSFIANALATELRADGDLAGAYDVIDALTTRAPVAFWRLLAPTQAHNMYVPAQRAGDGIELTFELPSGVREFHLEPPAYIGMRVTDATITARNSAGDATVPLLATVQRLVGMNQLDGVIYPMWNVHGHLRIAIPQLPEEFGHVITIRAGAELTPPPSMLDLAADPRALEVARQRADAGDDRMLRAIEHARARPYPLEEFEFFWATDGRFSPERNALTLGMAFATDRELQFEATAPVQGDATSLRIDFPPPRGMPRQFEVRRVVVEDAAGSIDIEVTPKTFQAVRQMHLEGTALAGTGSDPYVVLDLPRPAKGMTRVRVSGVTGVPR